MPRFIRYEKPIIYDEDFLEPAFIIQPTKPLTTPLITTETPVNVGVSTISEPNFSNQSSNTSSTSNVPSGNTSGTSGTSGNTSGTSGTSGSNGENKFISTITAKKSNYVLYGGILISAIILYKLLK